MELCWSVDEPSVTELLWSNGGPGSISGPHGAIEQKFHPAQGWSRGAPGSKARPRVIITNQ
eukprot:128650-Pelagomonas_calceolata.AAC.1